MDYNNSAPRCSTIRGDEPPPDPLCLAVHGFSMDEWKARTQEDQLLHAYWLRVGGRVYTEVPIGGPGGPGNWPPGCTIRRLDAVRVLSDNDASAISRFRAPENRFPPETALAAVELIEVKVALDRPVIGQIIAGTDMFVRQYGVQVARQVILCRTGDSALEWVCEKRGIIVEKV